MRTKAKKHLPVELFAKHIEGMELDQAARCPGRYANKEELMGWVSATYAEEIARREQLQKAVLKECKSRKDGVQGAADRAMCRLFQIKSALYHGMPTKQGAKYLEASLINKNRVVVDHHLQEMRQRCQAIVASGISKSTLATATGVGWRQFVDFLEQDARLTEKGAQKVGQYLAEHDKSVKEEPKSSPREIERAKSRSVRAKAVNIEEPNPRHDLLRDLIIAARDPEMCQVLSVLAQARKSFNGRTERAVDLIRRIDDEGLNAEALLEAYA